MKFEEAKKQLDTGKRIWNVKWHKTAFIFKELFYGDHYCLALWDALVEFPCNPRFKGEDDRLYSNIGHLRRDQNKTNKQITTSVQSLIAEYFRKAQHALGEMGFKIERNNLEDDWEVLE